jgi:hypothetical protein
VGSGIGERGLQSEFFDTWEEAESLRGTVFYCLLKDQAGEGTPVHSYGWNTYLKDMNEP